MQCIYFKNSSDAPNVKRDYFVIAEVLCNYKALLLFWVTIIKNIKIGYTESF